MYLKQWYIKNVYPSDALVINGFFLTNDQYYKNRVVENNKGLQFSHA